MVKKKKKKILIVSLSTAIVIGIVFIVAGVRRTPEKTVENYYNAINKRNAKKAMKCLNIKKDDIYYETALEGLNERIDNLDETFNDFNEIDVEYLEIKTIIDKVEIDEDDKTNAKVYYYGIIDSPANIKIVHEYDYVEKVNGKWLIDY